MDMDIPLPEELELLEQQDQENYYPDFDPTEPCPEPQVEPQSQPQPEPQSPDLVVLPEPQSNGHKRSRSDAPPDGSLSEEKRVRVGDSAGSEANEADEDWLRYSPSPPRAVAAGEEEEVRFVKEKLLSRYASEIDGECMPVTALNGDRVYAKLNRFEGVERARKLDWRPNSAGRVSYGRNFVPTVDLFLV